MAIFFQSVPAVHVFHVKSRTKDVDARNKRGHDVGEVIRSHLHGVNAILMRFVHI
jgi:hypothetical protein